MQKNMYNQPSVTVTEIAMVQTLCASGDPTPAPIQFDYNATTGTQL